MTENDALRVKLRFTERFEKLLNGLCLTDRQKEIVRLKYLRGWVSADIAAELDVSRKTITNELQVIRKVIGSIDLDSLND